jgi:tRNA G18 (ribose-2'-O)-methylase SpoU
MELGLFAGLKERELRKEGLLVAEGRFLVERVLSSGLPVLGVLCAPRFAAELEVLARGSCPVRVLSEERIAEVAGFAFHRGALAVARRPSAPSLEALIPPGGRPSTLIVCTDLTSAENLGSIIRTAAALGNGAVLVGARSCDPFSRRALKVSMGAALTLPLVSLADEREACARLKQASYTVAVSSLDPAAIPLERFRRGARLCVVFGNEANGVAEPWRSGCDILVTVPMRPGTDSLNVAVAAAIIMYALRVPTAP